MLNRIEQEGSIKGATIMRGGTSINHLLFVDDRILYSKATKEDWDKIQVILTLYKNGLGQTLSKQKSSIFFNSSTPERQATNHSSDIRFHLWQLQHIFRPTCVWGHSKYNTFRGLKDKIWKRVNNWTSRFLSQAGCEILIKAILQSIPIFTMSVFLLPKTLCQEISIMFARFQWNSRAEKGKLH